MAEVGLDAQWILPAVSTRSGLVDFVAEANDAGIGYLGVGDHISFRNGAGFDGLINASAILACSQVTRVHVGAYLLPARHPVLVARQLATIAAFAPGRISIAFGVGGEDRNEMSMAGVDPATRGSRTDEALFIVRELLRGEPLSYSGVHFKFERAHIQPAPAKPIPLLVAGRSSAALERTARAGDGWHGVWVSPVRFAEATSMIRDRAVELGRVDSPYRHTLTVWCGVDGNHNDGRERARTAMEPFYDLPFEKFERYVPVGEPGEIAETLAPYAAAGCQAFTLVLPGLAPSAAIAVTAEIGSLLRRIA